MKEVCPKCNGSRRHLRLVFFCPNPIIRDPEKSKTMVKCDKELHSISEIDSETGNRDDNIVELKCECGFSYSGKIEDIEYEERVGLCDCSKKMFEEKLELEDQLIKGHFPKELWKRDLDWYRHVVEFKTANPNVVSEIKSFTDKPETLSIYNIYWISGKSQSGTTSLAAIFAMRLVPLRKRIYFTSMHKFIEKTKDFDDKDYMSELLKYDVIVLDDAFSANKGYLNKDSEFMLSQFYGFLKEIKTLNKILICTSNILVNNIDNKYDAIKEILLANTHSIEIKGTLSKAIAEEKLKKLAELREGK